MADFDPWEDPQHLFQPTSRRSTRGKFLCSNFLFRLLLIAVFLSILPLLPSDPPEFISRTVFAKSWELVHLFVIGILVSYGLFGRRRTRTHMAIHSPPPLNTPNTLHASSIFSFEHQNPSGYSGYPSNNVGQAWDFRPCGLEPVVVVRPGTFDFSYEPLDLPVRSLRSRVEESDSEECASEFEVEDGFLAETSNEVKCSLRGFKGDLFPGSEFGADGSSSCCPEEDNESENVEKDMGDSSPTPWNWPNYAENSYLSSPGFDHEAKLSSDGDSRPSLSNQSSPLRSSSSETTSMGQVESSWSGPIREEDVYVSQPMPSKSIPMMADPKEEVGDVCFAREYHEVKHVKPGYLRPSSTKGPPFSSSSSESPPMEVVNPRMKTEYFPSPTSLKSRSMRVDFKEKVSLSHSRSFRSPESVPPMYSFMPPPPSEFSPLCSAASESPTIEMESMQKETKNVEVPWKEMDEDRTPLSFIQDDDLPLKRVGSRRRRSRKRDHFRKDVKGTMKPKSESSCGTTSSTPLSSSSHDFVSTIEPKSSRYTEGFSLDHEKVHKPPVLLTTKQVSDSGISKEARNTEIEDVESVKASSPLNAPNNDFVSLKESSSTQLGASSSLRKDAVQSAAPLEHSSKTLSRTSHSRRFSCSSFFDRDLWKGSKDETNEINKKGKNEDASKSGKCGWDCMKFDVKPTLTKGSSVRGKSVRTVRPPAITLEPSSTNENASLERRQDVVIISIGISGNKIKNAPQMNERSNERTKSSSLELDKHEKTSVVEDVNGDEECNSEIDRKADEFIAKFKEQIRLQKVATRRESTKNRT